MQFLRPLFKKILLGAAIIPVNVAAQHAQITVDASKVLNHIPANMYGACIEDVNHEIYGGLYGQRLFGESFEEPPASPAINGWTTYGGLWMANGETVGVKASRGYKLVMNRQVPDLSRNDINYEFPATSYTILRFEI